MGLYAATFSSLLFYELLLRLAPGQHYLTHERIRKQYDGGRIVVSASLSLRGERDAKKKIWTTPQTRAKIGDNPLLD